MPDIEDNFEVDLIEGIDFKLKFNTLLSIKPQPDGQMIVQIDGKFYRGYMKLDRAIQIDRNGNPV